MSSPSEAARRFVAQLVGAAEAAFVTAFEDGVAEACEELDERDEGDDVESCDWEHLLAQVSSERGRLLAFYLPAITKMSAEVTALFAHREGAILSWMRQGLSREEAVARVTAITAALERQLASIKARVSQMIEGLSWAASQLGRASVAGRLGRRIYWLLDPAAQHCETCPAFAAGSPYASIAEIGTVPGGPGTACKSRCRCHLEII